MPGASLGLFFVVVLFGSFGGDLYHQRRLYLYFSTTFPVLGDSQTDCIGHSYSVFFGMIEGVKIEESPCEFGFISCVYFSFSWVLGTVCLICFKRTTVGT